MAREYYFPNYPYNDVGEDPFLLEDSNAFISQCQTYVVVATTDTEYNYNSCFTNEELGGELLAGQSIEICSTSFPRLKNEEDGTVTAKEFDVYRFRVSRRGGGGMVHFGYIDLNGETKTFIIQVGLFTRKSRTYRDVQVLVDSVPFVIHNTTKHYSITKISASGDIQNNTYCFPDRFNGFTDESILYRQVFNSPETSFSSPFLGNVLKLENVMFGAGSAHFVPVENNALYKLITKEAQEDALSSSETIAKIGGSFDKAAMFAAYQAHLQTYINGISRKNYGWSYNSIASYDYYSAIPNNGFKQRKLETSQYLFSGFQSVGEDILLNNFNRESSVYLKTTETTSPLPFPHKTETLDVGEYSRIEESSRFINSELDCNEPEEEFDISVVAYYASIKNTIPNQWGQIYSYETIDTGSQVIFDSNEGIAGTGYAFGGDTFINKFAFKTKLPFFNENRVGAPDDSDIFYDEIGNIAYPEYWHSARSILFNYEGSDGLNLKNIISVKAHNLDCANSQEGKRLDVDEVAVDPDRVIYDGKMYMFAYGLPYFYCESSINVDLRQAFNNKEGDFFPHVGTGIPDDWLQETNVPISQDNTYYYNETYSKQNRENHFTHLPIDWENKLCYTSYPHRAFYSEPQQDYTDTTRVNNWLIYRPTSYFDFPQNYGALTSIDGIQNKAVLARFENKSLLYNTLLTIDTSNPQAAYLGNDTLFRSAPPIDFAETDLGYMGSQHKFLLRIPQGQITVDSKRGKIFLISGNQAKDLSALGTGLSDFLAEHLPFEISQYFSNVNIDNNFKGVGLHGVYDNRYNRIIISKLDYYPLENAGVKFNGSSFFIEETYPQTEGEDIIIEKEIQLTDNTYFCNRSWTLSYNLNTNSWISFHSYIPNYYIADNNFFYSGINQSCDLEAIAVEFVIPSTTTTTTTTAYPYSCDLDGYIAYPSTTTTTSTTTTSTSSTTTTTSTTLVPVATFIITNNSSYTIYGVSISDGADLEFYGGATLPITPGQTRTGYISPVGEYDITISGLKTVDESVRVKFRGSSLTTQCVSEGEEVGISFSVTGTNVQCYDTQSGFYLDVAITVEDGDC